jgi:hypothetical protein
MEKSVYRSVIACFAQGCLCSIDVNLTMRHRNYGYEIPPPHSITSSARASSVGGIVRRSALAAFRLMTKSNLVA